MVTPMSLDRPRVEVDFNAMTSADLVVLSYGGDVVDTAGRRISLRSGLRVWLVMDDIADDGRRDPLVASGHVERNQARDWSANANWCCRLDEDSIQALSDFVGR